MAGRGAFRSAFVLWGEMRRTNPVLAALTLAVILLFAVGAGIIAGIFSVNENKATVTAASKIHGAGAAIGFMALLLFPFLYGIWQLCRVHPAQGTISAMAFALALAFFACFILGDKERFSHTVLSYEGVWERLTLAAMYVPFVLWAAGILRGLAW